MIGNKQQSASRSPSPMGRTRRPQQTWPLIHKKRREKTPSHLLSFFSFPGSWRISHCISMETSFYQTSLGAPNRNTLLSEFSGTVLPFCYRRKKHRIGLFLLGFCRQASCTCTLFRVECRSPDSSSYTGSCMKRSASI